MPKMQMCRIGPLVVVKQLNDVMYVVKVSEKDSKVIHYDLLKLFVGRDVPCWVRNAQEKLMHN